MRKYVVPIVALMGIALLTPQTNAANLIIKSRVGKAGGNVSLPVSVTSVGGTTQLWGLDFALTYDATKLSPGTDPGGNGSAFTPFAVGTEVPVVVSGTTFVGTGATNPNLYVGIVRGTSAFTTTANPNGGPSSSIGLLRMAVPAGVATGTVIDLAVPANYNVANTGDGSTTNSRFGATGATSDATAGSAVAAETITVLNSYPVASGVTALPLHKVAVALAPGDVVFSGSSAGVITPADYGKVIAAYLGKTTLNDYEKIAADVGPANGYVPGSNYGGTAGLSYGDGAISPTDYGLLIAKYLGKPTATFPVAE